MDLPCIEVGEACEGAGPGIQLFAEILVEDRFTPVTEFSLAEVNHFNDFGFKLKNICSF